MRSETRSNTTGISYISDTKDSLPACRQYCLDDDRLEPQHQSRVMGIRGSVTALGEAVGPLLVAVVSLWTTPQGIFAISGAVTLVAVFLALAVLKGRSRTDLPLNYLTNDTEEGENERFSHEALIKGVAREAVLLWKQDLQETKKGRHRMSAEDNKATARRWYEEIFNEGNLDLIPELFAPNFIHHDPVNPSHGLEVVRQVVSMYRRAFPDLHMTIEDCIAEGDKVVTRFSVQATHTGPFMGIAPTEKQVRVTVLTV